MRAENRFELDDLNLQLPFPSVARQHLFTVSERVAADGSVLLAPSATEIDTLARRVVETGNEAISIRVAPAQDLCSMDCSVGDAYPSGMSTMSVVVTEHVGPIVIWRKDLRADTGHESSRSWC